MHMIGVMRPAAFSVAVFLVSILAAHPASAQGVTANSASGSGGGVFVGSNQDSGSSGQQESSGGVTNSSKGKGKSEPLFTDSSTTRGIGGNKMPGKSYGLKSAKVTDGASPEQMRQQNDAAKAAQAAQNEADRQARADRLKAEFEAAKEAGLARTTGQQESAQSTTKVAEEKKKDPADPYNGAKVTFENPRKEKDDAPPPKLFNTSR